MDWIQLLLRGSIGLGVIGLGLIALATACGIWSWVTAEVVEDGRTEP